MWKLLVYEALENKQPETLKATVDTTTRKLHVPDV
jgi:hypothetical protein